ncbi:MAG: alpha/beta hydrolase fold domain-containing protein [Armatimonadia bacterium]|nr:alpha/beta hydrolase fold domain-containing protein [Armatimonadia bacterium]
MKRWRMAMALMVAALALGSACAEQTSETSQNLQQFLKKFPNADANRDGVLTASEARAFRERREQRLQERAEYEAGRPDPDHADLAYGPHERNVLDLWIAEGDGPRPLAAYIHGGGWVGGDKSRISRDHLEALLEAGISVAAINYRYSTQAPFPAPITDAGRAIQFLRLRAGDYDLDPERIGTWGGSAGAATSMWLAFHDDLADPNADDPVLRESTRLTCIAPFAGPAVLEPDMSEEVLGAPVTIHPAFLPFFGVEDLAELETPEKRREMAEASPINHLTADDPPVWMGYSLPAERLGPDATPGEVAHHPLHGVYLKEKMDELGIEAVLVYPGHEEDPYGGHIGFFRAKLLGEAPAGQH